MLQRNIADDIGGACMRSRAFCCAATLSRRFAGNPLIGLAIFCDSASKRNVQSRGASVAPFRDEKSLSTQWNCLFFIDSI
jgi:hypothetical protein